MNVLQPQMIPVELACVSLMAKSSTPMPAATEELQNLVNRRQVRPHSKGDPRRRLGGRGLKP
jgi:hypothetical protein